VAKTFDHGGESEPEASATGRANSAFFYGRGSENARVEDRDSEANFPIYAVYYHSGLDSTQERTPPDADFRCRAGAKHRLCRL